MERSLALARKPPVAEIDADSAGFVLNVQSLRRNNGMGAVRLVVVVGAAAPEPGALDDVDDLPKDCRHIELLNQSDFIELNGLKWMD